MALNDLYYDDLLSGDDTESGLFDAYFTATYDGRFRTFEMGHQ